MNLLYYLFSRKNITPWEFYSLPQGYRDLTEALALHELEMRKAQ